MESKEKKSVNYYMRLLHRNIGFFFVGIVIIYGLSGIVLIYRDTDLLKKEKRVTASLSPDLNTSELGAALKIRDFRVLKSEGGIIYFQGGTYNQSSGEVDQTIKELIFPLNKLTGLHKTPSKNLFHWVTLAFGVMMLFMAGSSFWMFKSGSKVLRNGILTAIAGIIFAIILLFFVK